MSRRILIFVPGILGTEISDGQTLVWPPALGDILRQEKLLARIAKGSGHGLPIRSAYCRAVYEPIWKALQAMEDAHQEVLFHPIGFDWRLHIHEAAAQLGESISRQAKASERKGLEIVIVAHSMGGLVVRTLLEGAFKPWWAKCVKAVIFLGTPHGGAPRAAAAALGLASVQGIRAKLLRKSVEEGHFHSFLGLMPPSNAPIIQNWNGATFLSADTSARVCKELGADPKRVFKHWDVLRTQGANKPNECVYFCLGNTNVKTISSLAFRSGGETSAWEVLGRDRSGDDTVPTSSAFLACAMNYATPGNHLKLCESDLIAPLITMAFGLPATFAPFGDDADRAIISASPEDVEQGEAVDVHVWSDRLSDIAVEILHDGSVQEAIRVPPAEHLAWTYIPRMRGVHSARIVQDSKVLDEDAFFVHEV